VSGESGALRAFVDELFVAGIRDAIVCPGSRSTPVALALRAHAGVHVQVLIDERSAGFFALGLARTTRRPVVLLATSGTAVVNFAPAVVEASLARVPLVVLTADRPDELLDRGAPQTIDQNHLYGSHAKWFVRLDLDSTAPDGVANARFVAARAVATASEGPAGPVQIDLPLREPLIPAGDLGAVAPMAGAGAGAGAKGDPFASALQGRRHLDEEQLTALGRRLASIERGLIVAGPLDDPATHEPIARLAAATGFPILADPLSGLRTGGHDRSMVVTHADHLVRPGMWLDAHRPDLIVRFGAMPTSKPLTELFRTSAAQLIAIDGDGGWRESALVPATFVHSDVAWTAAALADEVRSATAGAGWASATGAAGTAANTAAGARTVTGAWTRDWLDAESTAESALTQWLGGLVEPFEGAPFRTLTDLLPAGSILWAGNSMPVRDLDDWLPSRESALRVMSNRGANGIDGIVSTALGSAAGSGGSSGTGSAAPVGPVALVVGDVSFLHDVGALVTARLAKPDLLVVLVNNDGGGIFSLLPQARASAPGAGLPEHFEELFGTPHGIDLGAIVRSIGFRHRLVKPGHPTDLHAAIATELRETGLRVVELRTDRARNAKLHHEAAAAVASALGALVAQARP
jgi:2-succinyl-5-enolpyruvyl-6-hydroxy-3-cyclohexene-1-carboxylate synthase